MPGSVKLIPEAIERWPLLLEQEVSADLVTGAYATLAGEPGHFGIVDDPAGILTSGSRRELAERLDRWARTRSREASLGAEVMLRRLPAPSPLPWSTVARSGPALPGRFVASASPWRRSRPPETQIHSSRPTSTASLKT